MPSKSAIAAILRRHELVEPSEDAKRESCRRFEHDEPKKTCARWTSKGISNSSGGRCRPPTVLDDNSRFSLEVRACRDEGDLSSPSGRGLARTGGGPSRQLIKHAPGDALVDGRIESSVPEIARYRCHHHPQGKGPRCRLRSVVWVSLVCFISHLPVALADDSELVSQHAGLKTRAGLGRPQLYRFDEKLTAKPWHILRKTSDNILRKTS